MLGYEIPLTIAMIGPAISAKSLSLSKIIEFQTTKPLFLLTQPIGFIIVITCLLAELHWTPFDIPDAESEIVAGWYVEFSGKKLALLKLAKDFELVLAASLMTSVYLGGSLGPLQQSHFLYFLVKFIFSILILSNIRALFARLTIDKILQGTWKYLTPIALLQIALVQVIPW
jgi:NADH-quinone oxidoreductase subunit H